MPSCLPEVAARKDNLLRSSCGPSALCVPCYDPLTGEDTNACRVGKDAPSEPAGTFETCCGAGAQARGRCVPQPLLLQSVPPEGLSQLGQDRCSQTNNLCVPSAWLTNGPKPSATCRAPGDLEGRCLPSCLPQVASRAASLVQRSCDSGELCVPCYDPLTGEDSKACRIGNDAPHEAAHGFAQCCSSGGSSLGTCVPTESLSSQQRSALPIDSCHTYDARCVPTELTTSATLSTCTSMGTGGSTAGVCLGTCFISSPLAALLPRASCVNGEHCVPCSNVPLSGVGCP